jgi:3-hydroxybutyryl-CoA dehydrogenase
MEWKQQLFARLDELAPPASVLATNTSGMSITAIASRAKHPERIVTTHFWNPPHLMPLVEVVKGEKTSDEVAHRVQTILTDCGKTAIVIQKDRPGQLGNRLQMALVREAANIIAEGIASAEDIDLTLKRGLGLRYPAYGLLEHQDLVGLEMGSAICEYVGRDLYRGEDLPQYMKTLVSSGRTGAASGHGFLTWPKGKAEEVKARRDAFLLGFLRSERGTDA